ncbi:MAG: AbrB/MazE/SpoVT family DNA-binding domain-containing protein [Actinomycetaceae bacterium]|nr:AbrB/MazE/SpoVT family DNA-binding domain-containing protein [Actinomycetaceae bacterium]MDY6083324.1 AbrB/MazE/SpoVT family DNA-binding domain-containing protein [Actinomycetaceae bacterium]
MLSGKLTAKGQVTIPVDVRRQLNLRAGDRLVFALHGHEIVMVKDEGDAAEKLQRTYQMQVGHEGLFADPRLDS